MSDKNFEEKLKKHWREEADSIPVPDSLHPAKIEEMVDKKMEFPKKRTHKKLYTGITAAAACLALLIAGTAYYLSLIHIYVILYSIGRKFTFNRLI